MSTNLRKLVYVPVLHAREDVDQKTGVLQGNTGTGAKDSEFNADHSAVGEMWAGIAAKIEELNLPWNKTRIYQDGLPVSGKELEIVKRLTDNGSWNHQLILNLLKKGAKLEGTENMDFLVREYDLLNVLLMKQSDANPGAKADLSAVVPIVPTSRESGRIGTKEEYQQKSRELLKLRDEFILDRIEATLQEGETGIVFMGVMHRLDKLLEKGFLVSYIIYRLPFRSVEAIYNA